MTTTLHPTSTSTPISTPTPTHAARAAIAVPAAAPAARPSVAETHAASSRYAARFLERATLQARLHARPAGDVPPALGIDTAVLMRLLAPMLAPDGAECFRRDAGPGVAVRRMIAPLPGGRTLAIDAVPATIRFHEEDLARLLQELVDNGRRYVPAGGTVRLRGAPGADGYQLSVTNPGEPLPRWVLAALRSDRPVPFDAGEPSGLSLGLSLASSLALLNDARLEVLRGAGRPNTLRFVARAG